MTQLEEENDDDGILSNEDKEVDSQIKMTIQEDRDFNKLRKIKIRADS
jgi:hypothetical protein